MRFYHFIYGKYKIYLVLLIITKEIVQGHMEQFIKKPYNEHWPSCGKMANALDIKFYAAINFAINYIEINGKI